MTFLYLTIDELCTEIEQTHDAFYQIAVDLAKEVNIVPVKKRTVDCQVHCVKVPADTTSDYYKRAVTILFLDHFFGQVQTQFSAGNLDILDMICGMPTSVISDLKWKDNFLQFLKKYENELPDSDFLDCELSMWQLKFSNQEPPLPSLFKQLSPGIDAISFPNTHTQMCIFGTIPATACSCERSILTLQ